MSKFLKDFDYNNELLRLKSKKYEEGEDDRTKRIKNAIYGLDGEERVAYQLRTYSKDVLCLHNIRLKEENKKIQVDFILISRDYLFLIEVKNLYGNIRLNENNTADRLIYKDKREEITSMFNPLIQMHEHEEFMERYLEKNNFNKKVESVLVMANNWTKIINNSKYTNIVRYDELKIYLDKFITDKNLNESDNELANLIKQEDIPYSFANFEQVKKSMIHAYVPQFSNEEEFELFEKLIKLRAELSKKWNINPQFIYNNKELERLIEARPLTKEEFLAIPGFKEKRFSMYGEVVIRMFRETEDKNYWLPKK